MPKAHIIFMLKREAKKSGGDRYEDETGFVIYIPQYISRDEKGQARKRIEVTFN